MNDDWARFCEMMAAAGWEDFTREDKRHGIIGMFLFKKSLTIYSPHGWIAARGKRTNHNVGDWRTWLEAGQTPSPF